MVDKRAGILPQQVVGGQYNAPGVTLDDGEQTPLQVTVDGRLKTDAVFDASDIEIGAVEIKDGASDNRATVSAGGALLVSNAAGSAIIGKVGIDQTTPGTTNGVVLNTGANVIGAVGHTTTSIGHGVKTVTTAGTDLALAGSTPAKWVTVQAQTDNTDKVAVGGAGVDATVATGTGIILAAGESITLPISNLAEVFVDALVNGEGVRFTYGA